MNKLENRKYDMLVRVRDFGVEHSTDFPANTQAGRLFATVNSVVIEIAAHAAAQTSGTARESTASKAVAKTKLVDAVEKLHRTARAMALDMPGLKAKFRLSRNLSDQCLLNEARAFLADATPLKNDFLEYAMEEDFLESLSADITAFEAAITAKNSKTAIRVSATAGIGATLDRGIKAVRQLQAVVKNKYSNSRTTLSAWASASRVERSGSPPRLQPNPSINPPVQTPAGNP
jgi:hypothetical protein